MNPKSKALQNAKQTLILTKRTKPTLILTPNKPVEPHLAPLNTVAQQKKTYA